MTRLAIAIALFAAPASAQIACQPHIALASWLERQHGESRVATGLAPGAVVELWTNPETRSWTILIVTPDGLACGAMSGEALEFAKPEKKEERS